MSFELDIQVDLINLRQVPNTVPFEKKFLKQDAIAINIQCACEQTIDLANYTIRKHRLGMPKNSRDSHIPICVKRPQLLKPIIPSPELEAPLWLTIYLVFQ